METVIGIVIGRTETDSGKIYPQWDEVRVTLMANSVASTFSFKTMITKENSHLFSPGSYTKCVVVMLQVDSGGNVQSEEVLITGYIVNPGISIQKVPGLNEIAGMSASGILNSARYPKDLYPLQYLNTSLTTIARELCNYYDIGLFVHGGATEAAAKLYETVECKPEETVYQFLTRIAKPRAITVAHDNRGYLMLILYSGITVASSEISQYDQIISMGMSPNMEKVHSSCLVINDNDDVSAVEGENSEIRDLESIVVNSPFLPKGINIPTTVQIKTDDAEKGNVKLKKLGEIELSEEARNFPVTIKKEGWDFDKRQVRAGFYLDVEAPSIFLTETKMFIETQTFTQRAKGPKFMTLSCVLPCVYTKRLPKRSPFNKTIDEFRTYDITEDNK